MKKKILIEGMSCGHCVSHVKEALCELKGISDVDVNLEGGLAVLETAGQVTDKEIRNAVDEAGYKVTGIEAL